MKDSFSKGNLRAIGVGFALLSATYGLRWAIVTIENTQAEQRVSDAVSDQTAARTALDEFRQKPKPALKSKAQVDDLVAALQLSTVQLRNLERTLDALPFVMDCGAADTWLDSRVAFHESEPLSFPEGADLNGSSIERLIRNQINGLDIELEKDCGEYPCMFTLQTETIPFQILERFYDEVALEFDTLVFHRPTCEACPEQFISFGAAEDPIPDSAFRRMRFRKLHEEER